MREQFDIKMREQFDIKMREQFDIKMREQFDIKMREQFDIKMHLHTCMFTCMCTCVEIQQMKTKSAVKSIMMSVIWLNSNLHFLI
jgi:hypothetical protein